MKYVMSWTTRYHGGVMDNENAAKRGVDELRALGRDRERDVIEYSLGVKVFGQSTDREQLIGLHERNSLPTDETHSPTH